MENTECLQKNQKIIRKYGMQINLYSPRAFRGIIATKVAIIIRQSPNERETLINGICHCDALPAGSQHPMPMPNEHIVLAWLVAYVV